MGMGFLQDLANTSATQNATQVPSYTMPTYNGGGYTTTPGSDFNYTTPSAPFWGQYTAPININPPQPTQTTTTSTTSKNPFSSLNQPSGPVYYDPVKGQYYTQSPGIFGWTNAGEKNYIGSSPHESKSSSSTSSFDNPSPLPNYSMYIPPSQMPDVNAYLSSPDSVLSSLRVAGVPIAGAGRYSNSLLTKSKGK